MADKRYSAVIVFDDKDKEPIPVSGLEGATADIVRGNIDRMFAKGYVRVDGEFDVEDTKEKRVTIVSKFFALEEIDHVKVVETKEIPQESKEVIAARKAREKAEKKKKK